MSTSDEPRALEARPGVVAGVGRAVRSAPRYAPSAAVVARLRHADDPDADSPLVPHVRRRGAYLDSHDGGSSTRSAAATGPPIVFCARRHALVAGLGEAVRAAARRRASVAVAFDHRGPRRFRMSATPVTRSTNLADDVRTVLEAPRPPRRDPRRPLDGRHGAAGVRDPHYPDVAAERVRGHGADVDVVATDLVSDCPARAGCARCRAPHRRRARSSPTCDAPAATSASSSPASASATTRIRATSRLRREMLAACPKAATHGGRGRALLGLDLTEGLPEIRVPTLVLSGQRDVIAPPAQIAAHRRADPRRRDSRSSRAPATCSCTSAPTRSTR